LTTNQFDVVLAHFQARQQTLLARWRDLARDDLTLPDQRLSFTDQELEDHLPELLQVLIDALRNESAPVPEKRIEQRGAQHGHTRRMYGYEIAQVAWEFALFRQLVRETLEELAPTQPLSILFAARELLMHLVDRSEFGSIEQYVREATRERDGAREELRIASEQKDRFLAVLSHELRNLLAATRTALHILRKEGIANAQRERALEVIDRQAISQARLIDDLLDLHRISQGQLQLKREMVDLRKSIDNVIEAHISTIEARGIRFNFARPDHRVAIFADPGRVEQLVSNLLANALTFTQPGASIEISLQIEQHDAVICVRNTGPCIDRSMSDRLVELFSQNDAAGHSGLGVNLWLATQLTQMYGGTLQASSEALDGEAEVTVRLPSASEEPDPKGLPAKRVLIVEDNPDEREMMMLALPDEETQIVGAKDAHEALALISEGRFDIYILDLNLPDASGYQLATKVLHFHRHNRPLLIALTAYGRPEDAAKVIEAGFDHHLIKPAEIDLLQRLIHSHAGG
jgi:two-component system, chemotaxis family, CheB/CheR fusion protein